MKKSDYKKAMAPFLMYLSDVYRATHTDKNPTIEFGAWLEYLDREEIIQYGNDFAKIILKK